MIPHSVLRELSRIRREEGGDSSQIMKAGIVVLAGLSPEARTAAMMIAEDCTDAERKRALKVLGDAAEAVLCDILNKRLAGSG